MECSDGNVSWAFSEQLLSLVLHQGRQSRCGSTPLLDSEALEVVSTLCFSPWLLLLYIFLVFLVPHIMEASALGVGRYGGKITTSVISPTLVAAALETGRCGGKITICSSWESFRDDLCFYSVFTVGIISYYYY